MSTSEKPAKLSPFVEALIPTLGLAPDAPWSQVALALKANGITVDEPEEAPALVAPEPEPLPDVSRETSETTNWGKALTLGTPSPEPEANVPKSLTGGSSVTQAEATEVATSLNSGATVPTVVATFQFAGYEFTVTVP